MWTSQQDDQTCEIVNGRNEEASGHQHKEKTCFTLVPVKMLVKHHEKGSKSM